MRAEATAPLGRARFTELSLLVWVAALAITGFVAVVATERSSFSPAALVVPLVFLVLMLALHVFLVSIRFRGDQLLLPIAAGLTAIGLVLVQRLASDLLFQQLSWSIIAAGAFAATIVVPRDLTALARFKWTWALLGGFVAYQLFGHVQARVDTWIRPFDEDLRFDTGFQLVQGLYALANGGLFGAGLGNGMPDRIPVVWSDFVFDAFAEEAGLAGALALLGLYLVFVYRGMLIALRAPTMFLQLLAAGLSFIVALQTLVIVGGNLRLIPLTGITLPFVAYGGSSLVTNWMLVGILMRVSQVSERMRGGGPS